MFFNQDVPLKKKYNLSLVKANKFMYSATNCIIIFIIMKVVHRKVSLVFLGIIKIQNYIKNTFKIFTFITSENKKLSF